MATKLESADKCIIVNGVLYPKGVLRACMTGDRLTIWEDMERTIPLIDNVAYDSITHINTGTSFTSASELNDFVKEHFFFKVMNLANSDLLQTDAERVYDLGSGAGGERSLTFTSDGTDATVNFEGLTDFNVASGNTHIQSDDVVAEGNWVFKNGSLTGYDTTLSLIQFLASGNVEISGNGSSYFGSNLAALFKSQYGEAKLLSVEGNAVVASTEADVQLDAGSDVSVNADTGNIYLSTQDTPRVYINHTGNVGVGTTSPTYSLDVASDAAVRGLLYLPNLSNASGDFVTFTGNALHRRTASETVTDLATPLGAAYFKQNGNSFGANAVIGTNDNYSLSFETNGVTRGGISNIGNFYLGSSGSGTNPALFPFTGNSNSTYSGSGKGLSLYNYYTSDGGNAFSFSIIGANLTFTSGNHSHMTIGRNFSPTLGTGTYNAVQIADIINQTGGANGVTRSLYITPTLTAAADYRGIEINSSGGLALYASGSAPSRFNGTVGIGITSTIANLYNNKSITGSVSYAYLSNGTIQSDITGSIVYNYVQSNTVAASFTVSDIYLNRAEQGTFGAGSTVTRQYGYYVHSGVIGAGTNYGFYGNIPAGTGRWNLYMNNTASNYLNGTTLIGTTADEGSAKLQVNGATYLKGVIVEESNVTNRRTYKNLVSFANAGANVGAIVIHTNISRNSRMNKIRLTGYQYQIATLGVPIIDITVGAYWYASAYTWNNRGYTYEGQKPSNVQIGVDASDNVVIIIGSATDTWQYPILQVTDWLVGFNGTTTANASGFTITIDNDLSGYSNLLTVPNVTRGEHPYTPISSLYITTSNATGDILTLNTSTGLVGRRTVSQLASDLPATGTTSYIQNQNIAYQSSANAYIDGTFKSGNPSNTYSVSVSHQNGFWFDLGNYTSGGWGRAMLYTIQEPSVSTNTVASFGAYGSSNSLLYSYWTTETGATGMGSTYNSTKGIRLYPNGKFMLNIGSMNALGSSPSYYLGLDASGYIGSRTPAQLLSDIGGQAAITGTGLVKSTGGTISYITDNSANWNTAYGWGNHAGLYVPLVASTGTGALVGAGTMDLNTLQTGITYANSSATNKPANTNSHIIAVGFGSYGGQIGFRNQNIYYRGNENTVWTGWYRIWHSGDFTSTDISNWNAKIGGSGATNYIPKFTASGIIGNSQIYDDGTGIGIGTNGLYDSNTKLHVKNGHLYIENTGDGIFLADYFDSSYESGIFAQGGYQRIASYSNYDNKYRFAHNYNDLAAITIDGTTSKVGINIGAPTYDLHVNGDIATSESLYLYDSANAVYTSLSINDYTLEAINNGITSGIEFAATVNRHYVLPDADGTIALQSWVSSNYQPALSGTGLLHFSGTTPSYLNSTTNGQVLRVSGGTVGFGSIDLGTSVSVGSTVLRVGNGGTGTASITGIVIGNGSSTMTAVTGTANQLLRRNAANTAYEFFSPAYLDAIPSWQNVFDVNATVDMGIYDNPMTATYNGDRFLFLDPITDKISVLGDYDGSQLGAFLVINNAEGFTNIVKQAIISDDNASGMNAHAALEISSTDKGLMLPRLETSARTSMSLGTSDAGLIVFDIGIKKVYYWDGTAWNGI